MKRAWPRRYVLGRTCGLKFARSPKICTDRPGQTPVRSLVVCLDEQPRGNAAKLAELPQADRPKLILARENGARRDRPRDRDPSELGQRLAPSVSPPSAKIQAARPHQPVRRPVLRMIENVSHEHLVHPQSVPLRFRHVMTQAEQRRDLPPRVGVVEFPDRQALAVELAVAVAGDVVEITMNAR